MLNSRERVIRMLERREHDRIPRHDTFWRETIERWQQQGLQGGERRVLELLESDFQFVARSDPVPYPGQRTVIEQVGTTETVRDIYGATIRVWKNRTGTPQHLGWECDSPETWERVTRPRMLQAGVQVDLASAAANYDRGRRANRWCYLTCIEAFELTRRMMGDETALIAMAADPEWVRDVSRTQMDLILRDFEAVLSQGVQPDGIWCFGDMAFKRSTMCSPQMYRELIWPDHERLAHWVQAHDMKLIYHTDGNVNDVVDMYIEAGFDCLQPLESKARMDIRDLVPKYGDKLSFFGNIDIMLMGTNDLARIEQEICEKITAGKTKHGYAYHSDHSVPPTVDWQTYQFVIDCVGKYGSYAPANL